MGGRYLWGGGLSAAVSHAALCMLCEWTLIARAVRQPATDGSSSLSNVHYNYQYRISDR